MLGADPDAGVAEIARAGGLTRTTVYAHSPAGRSWDQDANEDGPARDRRRVLRSEE